MNSHHKSDATSRSDHSTETKKAGTPLAKAPDRPAAKPIVPQVQPPRVPEPPKISETRPAQEVPKPPDAPKPIEAQQPIETTQPPEPPAPMPNMSSDPSGGLRASRAREAEAQRKRANGGVDPGISL